MISPKKRSMTHAWKLLGGKLIKYLGDCILLAAMSWCLRSLLSSLERVRTTDGFSRTHGYDKYMVELSSALSELFTTMDDIVSTPRLLSVLFGMFSTIE